MAREDGGLPTGTVTFLLTDVEGSTRLWEQDPDRMRAAVAGLEGLLRREVEARGGVLLKARGEGDSAFAVFARASDAADAALAAQSSILREPWGGDVRIRMGLHTGEAELREGDYYGPAVNRCARLRDLAHGGQILLSLATAELIRLALPPRASLRDLGPHRLKDLASSEHVFQLCRPDVPLDFPPLRSLDACPNNLPVQLTSFVGRERELHELRGLLRTRRLLTLTGPGGIGKTRLALQVGAEALEDHPDGVWLVDLTEVAPAGPVAEVVAQSLGLRDSPDTMQVHELSEGEPVGAAPTSPETPRALRDKLIDHLRPKKALLLFDNCEHAVGSCAELADAILRSCPDLKLLCTSREPLGTAGEASWMVPALSLPDRGDPRVPEGLVRYDSIALFVDRAALKRSDFVLTEDNSPDVAQICRRLDGIPLAIELAAARVPTLSPREIADRLQDRFRLLTGGATTAPPRHQTLRAAMDWSYGLLGADERMLFRRLSVFSGGFTLEAAERVCAWDDLEPERILDLLSELVERSLTVASEHAGATRYRMLETIRQYAWEKLHEPLAPGVEAPIEGALADAPSAELAEVTPVEVCVFRREGDYWAIGYRGQIFRLRHAKGLLYLHLLLSNPGRELHVLDLIRVAEGDPPPPRSREAVEPGLDARGLGDAGDILDSDARSAYKVRLAELEEELEEASEWRDPERAARAQEEIDVLVRELAAATGLGGRGRKGASAAERARVSATKAIKLALSRIERQSPVLGRHLGRWVRTGAFCSYVPDPLVPTSWEL